ncbi:MAG: hypothetical protein ACLU1S_10045 [Eubacterium sp.]
MIAEKMTIIFRVTCTAAIVLLMIYGEVKIIWGNFWLDIYKKYKRDIEMMEDEDLEN